MFFTLAGSGFIVQTENVVAGAYLTSNVFSQPFNGLVGFWQLLLQRFKALVDVVLLNTHTHTHTYTSHPLSQWCRYSHAQIVRNRQTEESHTDIYKNPLPPLHSFKSSLIRKFLPAIKCHKMTSVLNKQWTEWVCCSRLTVSCLLASVAWLCCLLSRAHTLQMYRLDALQ